METPFTYRVQQIKVSHFDKSIYKWNKNGMEMHRKKGMKRKKKNATQFDSR